MTEQFHHLNRLIEAAKHILLTTHDRPDGDAIGSLVGFAHHLESRGKSWLAFINDYPSIQFDFLDPNGITTDRSALERKTFDLIIFLDVGDVKRSYVSDYIARQTKRPPVVSIDHHPTKVFFHDKSIVDFVLVDPTASSTAELIYRFLRSFGATLDRPLATALLTGILTDTGSFSNLGTTVGSLQTAARLLTRGALIQEVSDRTWRNKNLTTLKLWGRILSRLKRDPATGFVSTASFLSDLTDCGVTEEAIDGLSNFLNGLSDTRVAVFLRESPGGLVRGSYRTTQPDVDVAALAAQYGGGGHTKSAGFTVAGRIVETPNSWQVQTA